MNALLVRSAREAAYLTAGLATSIIAFTVWVTAVTVSLSLALFIVGLPVLLASAVAFRWTAELDRRNASAFLGRPVRGRYRRHGPGTLLGRLRATFADPQTWRDFGWLTAHSVVGFTFGTIALTLIGSLLATAVLPLWYWSIPDGVQFGLWTVDNLPLAIASAFLAIPLGAFTIAALRWMAWTEALMAASLLGPVRRRLAY
jgi:putative sensor protein